MVIIYTMQRTILFVFFLCEALPSLHEASSNSLFPFSSPVFLVYYFFLFFFFALFLSLFLFRPRKAQSVAYCLLSCMCSLPNFFTFWSTATSSQFLPSLRVWGSHLAPHRPSYRATHLAFCFSFLLLAQLPVHGMFVVGFEMAKTTLDLLLLLLSTSLLLISWFSMDISVMQGLGRWRDQGTQVYLVCTLVPAADSSSTVSDGVGFGLWAIYVFLGHVPNPLADYLFVCMPFGVYSPLYCILVYRWRYIFW